MAWYVRVTRMNEGQVNLICLALHTSSSCLEMQHQGQRQRRAEHSARRNQRDLHGRGALSCVLKDEQEPVKARVQEGHARRGSRMLRQGMGKPFGFFWGAQIFWSPLKMRDQQGQAVKDEGPVKTLAQPPLHLVASSQRQSRPCGDSS